MEGVNSLVVVSPGRAGDSNTPAQNTSQIWQNVLVDWVSASFYSEKNFSDLQALFYLKELEILGERREVEFEKIDGARYEYAGYTETYKYSRIEFLHDPENHKWLLNMSGQGCREFEQISKLNYEQLFALLVCELNATFNRIDIAIDDYKSIFKVNTIRKAVYNNQCITKLKIWGSHQRGKISDNALIMDNFYIGTEKSRYCINVYDKKLEQEARGKEVKEKSWTRTEIRLKEEYASRFARLIATSDGCDNIGKYIAEFLNESLVFVKKKALTNDKNRSRLKNDVENYATWWRRFVGDVGKLSLSQKAPDKTVEKTITWLKNQVAPSLAVLLEVFDDDLSRLLYYLQRNGETRLNKTHQLMIEDAKNKGLTLDDVLNHLHFATSDEN